MIEVIALDLDGTLLRRDGTIGERTLRALDECREKGRRSGSRVPMMRTG